MQGLLNPDSSLDLVAHVIQVALTPIFLLFLLTHAAMIAFGIGRHFTAMPELVADTARDTRSTLGTLGLFGTLALLLRAFSLGGGTYTGIEAVSNGLQILREPRQKTGRRTKARGKR